MNISQTPVDPRTRIMCLLPSHWLKSPMTLTLNSVWGPYRKEYPLYAFAPLISWAPSFSYWV